MGRAPEPGAPVTRLAAPPLRSDSSDRVDGLLFRAGIVGDRRARLDPRRHLAALGRAGGTRVAEGAADAGRVLGLVVGFAGVAFLVWGRASFKPGGGGLAILAALGATLSYGVAATGGYEWFAGV